MTHALTTIFTSLYDDFGAFEHYGVNKYLSSFGLVVLEKYRGRSIGEQFPKTKIV